MTNVQLEIERLRNALEAVAGAISFIPNACPEVEKAYSLAEQALKIPSTPIFEELNGRLNKLNDQITHYLNEAAYQKQKADYYADQSGKEDEQIYFWAHDGEDHPESLVSAVTVVIRAADLREIVAERDHLKSKWEVLSQYDLTERLRAAHSFSIGNPEKETFDPSMIDDMCINRFAEAMANKMAVGRAKGRGGWANPNECSNESLATFLVEQISKGDPVDIGNYAMMLFSRKAKHEIIGTALQAHANNMGQSKGSTPQIKF